MSDNTVTPREHTIDRLMALPSNIFPRSAYEHFDDATLKMAADVLLPQNSEKVSVDSAMAVALNSIEQAAEHRAMMREATHRANDALDRLLRIDRDYTIKYLQDYLKALSA
jgi:hypothetical protein